MEVSVNDIASKIMESEAGPTLSLGLNLKVSISELLQALQQFQQKSQPVLSQPKPKANMMPLESKELAPAVQPGLVAHARGHPPGDSHTVPSPGQQPPSAEDAKPAATVPTVITQPSAWPAAAQNITWDNEIADLQPGREDYTSKCRWEPTNSSRKWILLDEALVANLKTTRLKWQPLLQKAPTGNTDAAVAEATSGFIEMA